MRYRPDIDGLRAFAIAAVVLFHAGFASIPGGFVGVDIFFVISGFLITGLIVDRLRQGAFSFWEFYARRTRRILPALFAMLPVVLLAGYFVLTPAEYKALGDSAVYSSAFLANVYFWRHTGYFDQPAETMPLLHLWSIAVEEQFYLVWPLSVALVWRYLKFSRAVTLVALIGTTVLLALVCVVWSEIDTKSAFFLPFTRLWEFTLGALLLALPPIRHAHFADALSVLGLVAMGYAALTFGTELTYPGYYAVLPCLGAAAVMAAGESSLVGRALSLSPSVFLGKVSYSLYLWHWPIIVFYGFHEGTTDLPLTQKLTLILVALAVATLSWYFIEVPIRRRRDHPRLHVMYGASVAAAVGCLGFLVASHAGFPGRLPENVRLLSDVKEMTAAKCFDRSTPIPGLNDGAPVCVFGVPWANATRRAILWGDSHAGHLAPLLDLPAGEQGLSLIYWRGCAPFVDDETVKRKKHMIEGEFVSKCGRTRRQILDFIRATPSVNLVIIANAWPSYPTTLSGGDGQKIDREEALSLMAKGLAATIAEIGPQQHSILLIGDVPRPRFDVAECAVQAALKLWRKPCAQSLDFIDSKSVFKFHRATESILANQASDANHVYYLSVLKAMCGPEGCPLSIGGEILYADESHFRRNLSLRTRESLVSMLHLDEALRSAVDMAPSGEHAEAR